MMNFALAMSFAERAAYSGKMVLIGLGTVFGALVILMIVLMLFRRIVSGPAQEDEGGAPTPASAPTPAPATAAPVAQPSNDALIAAITAAVAAALAEENGGVVPAFRVVSFQKVTTVSKRK